MFRSANQSHKREESLPRCRCRRWYYSIVFNEYIHVIKICCYILLITYWYILINSISIYPNGSNKDYFIFNQFWYMNLYVYIYIHTHIYIYICIIYACTHTHIFIRTHTHTHIYMYILHIYMCVCNILQHKK